jgi:hypothetical protein
LGGLAAECELACPEAKGIALFGDGIEVKRWLRVAYEDGAS